MSSDEVAGSGETEEEQEDTRSPIEKAFSYTRWNRMAELLSLFDRKGIDIDARNEHGNTMLHIACQNGHFSIVEILCGKGADLDAQNGTGQTAMHFSRYYDYHRIFNYLRQQGARNDIVNHAGRTCYDGL